MGLSKEQKDKIAKRIEEALKSISKDDGVEIKLLEADDLKNLDHKEGKINALAEKAMELGFAIPNTENTMASMMAFTAVIASLSKKEFSLGEVLDAADRYLKLCNYTFGSIRTIYG